MSKQENATTGKSPSHYAYQVREREGKKSIWVKVGSAWLHSDGNGLNLQLDCVPLDGRITLRVPSERDEQ
jgi:hypothetical protein